MNTKNNKRRRESVDKMEKALTELLQEKELNQISVSDICKLAELNRSTFYANFLDIYDLADHLRHRLEEEFTVLFQDYDTATEQNGDLKMFTHIKENQLFYRTYFKLCYKESHQVYIYDAGQAERENISKNLKYHIEFFRAGINAIIKLWMDGGCVESPEEMVEVLVTEYRGRRGI